MKKLLTSRMAMTIYALACSALCVAHSQGFSPAVKQFISYDADTLALTHALVIDGTGRPPRPDQTVLIARGKILAVGHSASLGLPAGARVIDCSGKTLIPGMIMMHEHMFYGESSPPFYLGMEMPVSFPRLYLAGGVTTMRTTGSVEPQTDLNIRDWIREGTIVGPDIDVTGPYIERSGIPIPEVHFLKSPEEAVKEVNYWADMGCTSFKMYMDVTRADMKATVEAAHKRGIKVTGHLCSVTYREAADLGIDNLEHGFWVASDFEKDKQPDICNYGAQTAAIRSLDVNSPQMKDLMQHLVQKNVSITSTLPVFVPFTGREVFPGGGDEAMTPAIREVIEKRAVSVQGKDSATMAMFRKEMAWEKQFVEMGGRLMAGIDPTGAGRVIPGYADRLVLELLVEAGFSIQQAVQICSMNAASYLGREKEIGSIEAGKNADLVLFQGNPEKDIHSVRNTEIVFKNGIGFDSKKLFAAANGQVGLH